MLFIHDKNTKSCNEHIVVIKYELQSKFTGGNLPINLNFDLQKGLKYGLQNWLKVKIMYLYLSLTWPLMVLTFGVCRLVLLGYLYIRSSEGFFGGFLPSAVLGQWWTRGDCMAGCSNLCDSKNPSLTNFCDVTGSDLIT